MMCQKLGHEDAPSTSRSAPCGSPHLLTRAWRTGLASTSTCTLKGYSVDASPSLTCFHGTVAPSKSPCWSPAIALSGRRPVRCSSWSRHTWEIDLLVWTAATVPYSSSLSAGTCQVCGMSSTCSWWDRPHVTPAPGASQQGGSWWRSAWLFLRLHQSSAATWRATFRDTQTPPATRNVSF